MEGRVYAVEIRPVERNTVLAAEIADSTGQLTALFYGRSHIPGLDCGAQVRFRGQVGIRAGAPVMINPAYELLAPGDAGRRADRSRRAARTRRGAGRPGGARTRDARPGSRQTGRPAQARALARHGTATDHGHRAAPAAR